MLAYTFYESDNRVRRYAEALARRGDRVDVIALARSGEPRIEMLRGVRVLRIYRRLIDEKGPWSYLLKLMTFFFLSAWTIAREHLRERYDIIHVHSVPDFEVFATLIPKLMGARIILDIHDLVPEFYASKFNAGESSLAFRLLLFMERLSIRYANHVIISNDLWYDKLIQRSARKDKCSSFINYPDLTIFKARARQSSPEGEFVLYYPGSLNWHQGVDIAIEALDLLHDRAPDVRFLIVGDGPDREKLRTMIREKDLGDRVFLEPATSMERVAEMMVDVDLGVVPKRTDSFGNEAFSTKIMEFMAMNVPVLASRTRIDEYYFTDQLVHFFESGNAADLAEKIYYLKNDPERRRNMSRCSAEFIAENNWDVKQKDYFALVDRLVAA